MLVGSAVQEVSVSQTSMEAQPVGYVTVPTHSVFLPALPARLVHVASGVQVVTGVTTQEVAEPAQVVSRE